MRQIISEASPEKIVQMMQMNNLLADVRKKLYHGFAAMEQAQAQRKPPSVIELRRMELMLAQELIELVQKEKAQ